MELLGYQKALVKPTTVNSRHLAETIPPSGTIPREQDTREEKERERTNGRCRPAHRKCKQTWKRTDKKRCIQLNGGVS